MDLTFAAIFILSAWVVVIVAAGLVLALRPGGAGVRFNPAAASPATGPRDEIPLGGTAEVLGNVRGRVRAVLVDPKTRQLAAIRLATGLEDEDVPASAILGADGQVVRLADAWPESSPDGSYGSMAVLRGGMPVVTADGKRLGRLRTVVVDSTSYAVTALVVDAKANAGQQIVPSDRVTEAGPERIMTSLRAADESSLQGFATDWEIRQGILAALANDPALRMVQRSLRIEVVDQRVRVSGYVDDRAQADQVEREVRGVPGVLQPDLQLITDDGLADAVRDAIARDSSTANARVKVTTHSGVVDISGEAPDRVTARRIDAVARQVAGVQAVHNMVGIRPATAAAS